MSDQLMPAPCTSSSSRWARVLREETGGLPWRLWAANALGHCTPSGTGGRLRAALYRSLGLNIGSGVTIFGPITFASSSFRPKRIRIGAGCFINSHVYIDASAPVTLGAGVSVGHHVVIVTADHAIGPPEFRAGPLQPAPVTVEDGAWLGACVMLLPGVTVGHGAVVAAGAVVTKDVPPDTLVGGVPARPIRKLEERT
jgi:maltose O-acetyltransferase